MTAPRIFFTADTHIGHRSIIDHCLRPFGTGEIDPMNTHIINRINDTVTERDTLYHLGDVAWRPKDFHDFLSQLRCQNIHLLKGNHDDKKAIKDALATGRLKSAEHLVYLRAEGFKFVLCHYSFRSWRRDWLHLHGHSHGTLDRLPKSLDVGVDSRELIASGRPFGAPVSLEEVVAMIGNEVNPDHSHRREDPISLG